VAAFLAGLSLHAALAQTTTPSTPAPGATAAGAVDPARLALAKKLISLNGGNEAMTGVMRSAYLGMAQAVSKQLPASQTALAASLQHNMADALGGIAPALIDASAEIYAQVYTEQELSDIIAFKESPTGQAMTRKQVELMQVTIAKVMPLVAQAMPQILKAAVEKTCAEHNCSPAQHEIVATAVEKALHSQGS